MIRVVAALLSDRRICMKNDKPYGYYEYLENDDVSSEQNSDEYSYPRRYGVRFIMKGGKCYGSASMKKYDDETAYISYVYIEEVDNADELSASVIKHLEEDAKKAGMSRIFTNTNNRKLIESSNWR
jgi:N-acetylglutamate synthase-like GNAT family acetyltransferase